MEGRGDPEGTSGNVGEHKRDTQRGQAGTWGHQDTVVGLGGTEGGTQRDVRGHEGTGMLTWRDEGRTLPWGHQCPGAFGHEHGACGDTVVT